MLSGIPQYYYCNLINGGKRKLIRVHRLVAQSFLPKIEGMDYVDHIDMDKLNNHVSNLRWVNRHANSRNMENNFKIRW